MVGMPKYLSEDMSAFLARNFYPNLNASCCLYSHVRKPWILVSSRISGIWRFEFFFQVFGQEHEIELMPRWLFWRTGLGKDGRKERNHFLWNTICSESRKPTRLSTYQLVSFNLCYLSPLIGEWKYLRRVSSTIMSASTHNNILGVTLSGDFCDVCTLSDLRPNHSWATPHKISLCLARPPLPNKLIPFLTISLFWDSSQVLKEWSCGREFVQTDLNNMEYSWKLAHWIDLATIYFPILLAIFPELSQPIILTEQRLRLPFPHWPWAGQAFNLDQSEASIYKLFPTCYLKFPK